MSFCLVLIFAVASLGLGQGANPAVKCPVPISPQNGQIFLTKMGTAVKYTCNPGFELQGPQISICKDDQWYPDPPTCELVTVEDGKQESLKIGDGKIFSSSTPRPLFKWDDSDNKTEVNDTMQGDEARVVFIRRPLGTGESWPYYYRSPVHVVLNHGENEVQTNEEALRHYYWASQYPRSSLVEYASGHPLGITLSESQLAWINSLHPEVRDRYLKDLYDMKVPGVDYVTYPGGYPWVTGNPYLVRQPVSVVIDDPVAAFDYSCHRTERDGSIVSIKAPRLPNAYVHRYHRRQNPNHPHNDYLAAQYRCQAGHTLMDTRFNELYCSRSSWIGNPPVCVPKA